MLFPPPPPHPAPPPTTPPLHPFDSCILLTFPSSALHHLLVLSANTFPPLFLMRQRGHFPPIRLDLGLAFSCSEDEGLRGNLRIFSSLAPPFALLVAQKWPVEHLLLPIYEKAEQCFLFFLFFFSVRFGTFLSQAQPSLTHWRTVFVCRAPPIKDIGRTFS